MGIKVSNLVMEYKKGEKEKMPGMGTEKREKDVSNHEG